ncbi:FKBP-type peptidyl-prolyl cis-trans isomerase FkpA [Oxalobacteraceae bacterium GrIS 2.11]
MMNSSLQIIAVLVTAVALCACDRSDSKVSIPNQVPVTQLSIRDTQPGTGAQARKDSRVTVHYTGWLYDSGAPQFHGKQFDSSLGDDNNQPRPFSFVLGAKQVIPGWDQGVPGMKVGGKRILIIPGDLAYGERGAGRGLIPKNAPLIFEIELLAVK